TPPRSRHVIRASARHSRSHLRTREEEPSKPTHLCPHLPPREKRPTLVGPDSTRHLCSGRDTRTRTCTRMRENRPTYPSLSPPASAREVADVGGPRTGGQFLVAGGLAGGGETGYGTELAVRDGSLGMAFSLFRRKTKSVFGNAIPSAKPTKSVAFCRFYLRPSLSLSPPSPPPPLSLSLSLNRFRGVVWGFDWGSRWSNRHQIPRGKEILEAIDHGIRCVGSILRGRVEAPPICAAVAIRRRVSGSQSSWLERSWTEARMTPARSFPAPSVLRTSILSGSAATSMMSTPWRLRMGNYMQRRRKYRRGSAASHTMLSLLRKDLREGNLQALLGGSSYMAPPPAAAPDPFISSLIYTLPLDEPSKDAQPESFDEGGLVSKSSDKEVVERVEPSLSDKDQKERARRSEFARGLVLSTIFDDIL
ncbi:hypothetical protein MUK42_05750, partial [Musa troglodytarum]